MGKIIIRLTIVLSIFVIAIFNGILVTVALSNEKGEQNMSSSRYSVVKVQQEGATVYVLKDNKSSCEAMVVPEFGNNCFSYSFHLEGEKIDVLEPIPRLSILKERPSGYGIPILFPFPNRIREGKFTFEGMDYQFDVPSPGANSIHGLVLNRPWMVEKSESDDIIGAQLVCSIKSSDFPDAIRQYPFPFNLQVMYRLKDGILSITTKMENTGQRNMPVGYGIHPYFSAPLSRSSSPADCEIKVPVRKYWELKDFLPTGKILEATGRYNLKDGVSTAGIRFDDVFTDIVITDNVSRCFVDDKKAGMRMILESDPVFREIVVYTPPNRSSVCFEPYTCPTDAINLQQRGIDAGVIVLKPGESISAKVKIIFEQY